MTTTVIPILLVVETGDSLTLSEVDKVKRVVVEQLNDVIKVSDYIMDSAAERITPELYSIKVQ